jgi:hypothetical protein
MIRSDDADEALRRSVRRDRWRRAIMPMVTLADLFVLDTGYHYDIWRRRFFAKRLRRIERWIRTRT